MSYHQAHADAQAVIAAADRGDYDTGLGITPEYRALLDKVHNTSDPLTLDDLYALSAFGEHELIVAADNDGRFTTTQTTDTAGADQ